MGTTYICDECGDSFDYEPDECDECDMELCLSCMEDHVARHEEEESDQS